ncbi:SRPBCC family protein [Cryptosporangium arvum]|uniref:SRPBCC family protein n=1 Tax=Cryptosporangium arvum TaxID=80871 RepID=UPI00055C5E27|nr:SRPBCC domain-containing protein [Cryptosporangium arvum]
MERPTGQTKDVGWEIGVSRTIPHGSAEVWAFLTSPEGAALWVGPGVVLEPTKGAKYVAENGTSGEVRSFRPGDRVRLTWRPNTWSHDSIVQLVVRPAATGTSVRFHQEHLADADEREQQRNHWRDVLGTITAALAQH